MANIIDYLKWRGDLVVGERQFNDVDNVILATLSYIDFTGIVPGPEGGSISIKDACNRVIELTDGNLKQRVKSLAKLDAAFPRWLSQSRRYCHMMLHDYVDSLDTSRSLQFAALQIDVSPTATYVSFRGTDSTFVGWREDFMLSFTVTQAQKEAAAYLERALWKAKSEGRTVYVGGHSKGGNLAVYAVLTCPQELRSLVTCVWNNDGPGFAPEIMPDSPFSQLGSHYKRIVPAYDMVGILFERDDDPRIVSMSSASTALQHDPFTWKVTPTGIDVTKDLSTDSKLMKNAIQNWISGVQLEQRASFVDELFDALEASGAQNMVDLVGDTQALKKTFAAIDDMDVATKSLLVSLVGSMLSSTVDAATTAAQVTANAALQTARGWVDEWVRNNGKQLPKDTRKSLEAMIKERQAKDHEAKGRAFKKR